MPGLSGFDWDQTSSSIAVFLGMAAGFVLLGVAALLFGRWDARAILGIVLLSAAIAEVVAIAAFQAGEGVGPPIGDLISTRVWDSRAFGPFFNSNYLGFFAAQAGLLAAGWAIVAGRGLRLVLIASVVLSVAGLLATFSRGGLIGAAVGGTVLIAGYNRRWAVIAVVALAVASLTLYPLFIGARVDLTFGDTSLRAYADETQSEQWRLDAILAGLAMFASQPVFGVGFGAYHFLSPRYVGASPVTYAHDWYVNVLAEQGLVGTIAFAAFVIWLVVAVWRSRHPLRVTALALLAAYAAGSLSIDSLPALDISLIAWLTVAAVLAPRFLPAHEPEPASTRSRGAVMRGTT
jgi:O-antigen ligase